MTTSHHVPAPLRATRALEQEAALDTVVAALQPVADTLAASPLGPWLRGERVGHAVHPVMTDLPIGFFASSTALDVLGGKDMRSGADKLLGLGLLTTIPTVVTGLADWATASRETKRVGVAHALANEVAATAYGLSWLARRGGRRGLGVALSLAGGAALSVGGYLGGHLALERKHAPSPDGAEEPTTSPGSPDRARHLADADDE